VKGLLAALVLLVAGCGGSSATPRATLNVPITVLKHGGQVLAVVPVTIEGKGPYEFAIDTGASQSLIDSGVAKELGVRMNVVRQKIAGVSAVSRAATLDVKAWRVGRVQLPATTIIAVNLPFGNPDGGVQGLLGSDMLSQFDVVTIDYARSRLVLHHRAPQ
jgi:predicted aspartyl protease